MGAKQPGCQGQDANWEFRAQAAGESTFTVLDLVSSNDGSYTAKMYFSYIYTILANPEVEPHAHNTYQSKLVPSDSINTQ